MTEGAIDDSIRHAISKLARYHFVAAEPYRHRVIQLGEQPSSVFNVGDPALDNIALLPLLDRDALCRATGLDPRRPYLLVTYHPVTLGNDDPVQGMEALIAALDGRADHGVLITMPNADAGGRRLAAMVAGFAARHPDRVVAATSLGQLTYLSAMKHCAAVVGNSSSGIIEAPALRRPTVNIGPRQDGRLKADSIIDCAADAAAIAKALQVATSRSSRLHWPASTHSTEPAMRRRNPWSPQAAGPDPQSRQAVPRCRLLTHRCLAASLSFTSPISRWIPGSQASCLDSGRCPRPLTLPLALQILSGDHR